MPNRLHGNVGICIHRSASVGIRQCENDYWKSLQKGVWKFAMSPYDTRFIVVKSKDKVYGSIIVYVEEEFQQCRLVCLGVGFVLMLLAPIVSNWVPFYYSSSMALGVLLVILLILFQGMKHLPMGRKKILYLTLYGSVLGIVGIALAGAALGYWIVRKYVLSEDGTIDFGIAQFVKWALRIIAMVLILQDMEFCDPEIESSEDEE